ncbi:hypothetical protein P4311_30265 [Bacillus thuringiensis]|nr:hypothetical protein [Bacillus thuringiensis]MRB61666.1 hypothetical protein [Bacillus thuringiensis]
MKKYKKLVLSILFISMLIIGVIIVGKSFLSFTNPSERIESYESKLTFEEELAYNKTINPNITKSEIYSLRRHRKKLDTLHKKMTELGLDYGISVDDMQDLNEGTRKNLDDRTLEKRKNYFELLTEIWNAEMRFLKARYRAGLIEKSMYEEEKRILKELKKKYME